MLNLNVGCLEVHVFGALVKYVPANNNSVLDCGAVVGMILAVARFGTTNFIALNLYRSEEGDCLSRIWE